MKRSPEALNKSDSAITQALNAKPIYAVSYRTLQQYRQLRFDQLWPSLRFWWQLRRHPAFTTVKWRIDR